MWCAVTEFAALLAPDHHQLAALLQHNPSVSVGVVNLQYEGNVLATQVILLYIQFSSQYFISDTCCPYHRSYVYKCRPHKINITSDLHYIYPK